jgi:alpha-tubulin suppressor-like RCC1 family protein
MLTTIKPTSLVYAFRRISSLLMVLLTAAALLVATPDTHAQLIEGGLYRDDGTNFSYITGTQDFIAVDGLSSEYIALKNDGTVFTWSSGNTPSQVTGLTNVTMVSKGYFHNLAVRDDGTLWVWGEDFNCFGILGLGPTFECGIVNTPTQIPGITNVTAIDAGISHSAIVANGTVYTWGTNVYGWLGFDHYIGGDSNNPLTHPATCLDDFNSTCQSPTNTGFAAVDVAVGSTDNLDSDDGSLTYVTPTGDVFQTQQGNPMENKGLSNIVSVYTDPFAGLEYYAVDASGNVFSWGAGYTTGLGRNSGFDELTPAQIPGLTNVKKIGIDAYYAYAVALTNSGELYGWGESGNAATDPFNDTTTPQLVTSVTDPVIEITSNPEIIITGSIPFNCGANNTSQTATNADTTVCLEIQAGVSALYAGDDTDNDDICTPGDDTFTVESIACDVTERSSTLAAKSVLNVRQETNSVVNDIVIEDLRGLQAAQYDVDVNMCNLVGDQASPENYPLGYQGDLANPDPDPLVDGLFARVDADTNGAIEALKPQSTVGLYTGGENTNWSKGADTTVRTTATAIGVYNTTADVTPGRYDIDAVDFGFQLPAFIEVGNYTCDVTFTLTV